MILNVTVNDKLDVVFAMNHPLMGDFYLSIAPDNGFTIGNDNLKASLSGATFALLYKDRNPKRISTIIECFGYQSPNFELDAELAYELSSIYTFARELKEAFNLKNTSDVKFLASIIPEDIETLLANARADYKVNVSFIHEDVPHWSTTLFAVSSMLYIDAEYPHLNIKEPKRVLFEVFNEQDVMQGKGEVLVTIEE